MKSTSIVEDKFNEGLRLIEDKYKDYFTEFGYSLSDCYQIQYAYGKSILFMELLISLIYY